ncbi:1496_t:CDS:1 [Acaulospora morrowiae]|uniref:1496_t:CDS:1 n=1 Tax=Acaulospora morrowiae TaxID=94023 RepID=A0A9N9FDE6_9GLOM|nr:1496_t:CDS:1 [Acaulospora morrowiae]
MLVPPSKLKVIVVMRFHEHNHNTIGNADPTSIPTIRLCLKTNCILLLKKNVAQRHTANAHASQKTTFYYLPLLPYFFPTIGKAQVAIHHVTCVQRVLSVEGGQKTQANA